MRTTAILASTLIMFGGVAHAAVTGFAWREVSNGFSPYPGNAPTTLPAGSRTFDLYVIGDTVGDVINGVNFGGDGSVNHIQVVGGVYNHPMGGNDRSFAFEPLIPDLVFDTYACFGGGATTNGQATNFAGLVNLTGANNELRFTTFTQPSAPLTPRTFGSHAAEIRVLRVTTLPGTTSLGGGGSIGEIGLAGGALLSAHLPWGPAPGGVALFALPCLLAARRASRTTPR